MLVGPTQCHWHCCCSFHGFHARSLRPSSDSVRLGLSPIRTLQLEKSDSACVVTKDGESASQVQSGGRTSKPFISGSSISRIRQCILNYSGSANTASADSYVTHSDPRDRNRFIALRTERSSSTKPMRVAAGRQSIIDCGQPCHNKYSLELNS
jgi:hypothetical protein